MTKELRNGIADESDDDTGGMLSGLRRGHLMTHVSDFAGTLDTAAAVTIGRLAQLWIVDGQRRAARSDVVAGRRVVAGSAHHRRRPVDEDDDDNGGGQ